MTDLPFRLCAIDLDDTLLNEEHALSERTINAIQKARGLGVIVVLASGRMNATTIPYAKQLALDTPIIAYNGALVKSAKTGEIWLEEHVSAVLAQEVCQWARENNLQLNFYLHDLLYSAAYTSWLKLYHERTGAPIETLSDFDTKLRDTTPTKLVVVDAPDKIAGLLPTMKAQYEGRLTVMRSNAEYLEFLPLGVDKGKALAIVADHYGVPQAQTLAFGDSWNDIPMLHWAGMGIAVANAKPEVITAADRIVKSNAEDGVAFALADIFGFEA